MSKQRQATETLPPLYAMTLPGLEDVAAEEIATDLKGDVKKTSPGLVVFRVEAIDDRLLQLRTVEDVFLLAWGTDRLTHRAEDLDHIRRWTAKEADWTALLRLHHAVRPKPKGKPTYHLVAQMEGKHAYRRVDALEAMAKGLAGKVPSSWKPVEEGAAVEIWLTIDGATAVCGLRLSDQSMRHRTYKREHRPASLRPVVAAAMVRLAHTHRGLTVLDPMCGAGTILAEQVEAAGRAPLTLWGGDLELDAIRAAGANLRRLGQVGLCRWDARQLPLRDTSVDRIISNPPFGKQLATPEEVGPLYRRVGAEWDRVLKPGGRVILLVSDFGALKDALRPVKWKLEKQVRVRVLGQPATISVWRKPG